MNRVGAQRDCRVVVETFGKSRIYLKLGTNVRRDDASERIKGWRLNRVGCRTEGPILGRGTETPKRSLRIPRQQT